ncbi:MAG: hypothetical protein ACYTFV_06255 [Planctomycetota bacterium]|jgi:hypothetical protein
MTYARARLWTGISGVGSLVLLASILLAIDQPATALAGTGGDPLADALALLPWIAAAVLVTAPFDLVGGYLLPRRFGRSDAAVGTFLVRWMRGVAVVLVLATLSAVLLLAGGRAAGLAGSLGVLALLAGLALEFQGALGRTIGGLRRVERPELAPVVGPRAEFVEASDLGYTGGFSGWGARSVWPAAWADRLSSEQLALLVERRRRILESGAWTRGRLGAIVWTVGGFALAAQLPGAGTDSPAALARTALGFTLWTFLGLLLLPALSRRATRRADAAIATDEGRRRELLDALQELDRLQDDEPERSPALESVFHPVTSVANRAAALDAETAGGSTAWHLARTALFLSHLGLSLLPRAVHCNAGRPELWVHLPADG